MKVIINAGSIGTSIAAETVHVHSPEPTRSERTAVCALVLASNPPGTARLRLDQEIRSIDEAIRRGRYRDRFELAAQLAVRGADLTAHLLRYQPEILHFAGHSEMGALIVEDNQGRAYLLEPEDLHALVKLLGRRTRCIVLNACLTRSQAEILAQHVPSVIGMSQAIGDPSAIEFAIGFYEALAYGESVQTAFELGSQRFARCGRHGPPRDITPDIDGVRPRNVPMLLGSADPNEIRFF